MLSGDRSPGSDLRLEQIKITGASSKGITSPLAFDVAAGENQLAIDLQGPPASKKSAQR